MRRSLLLIIALLLAACTSAPAPAPTETSTPLPTSTPAVAPSLTPLEPSPTLAGPAYIPISAMTDASQCQDNLIQDDTDVARLVAQMEPAPAGEPDLYVPGWVPNFGLPYPPFMLDWSSKAARAPALPFCAVSAQGGISYWAIDKFPLRTGLDSYVYVPAVVALDQVMLLQRARAGYGGGIPLVWYSAHATNELLFQGNTSGRIFLEVMGDRFGSGVIQPETYGIKYNPEYMAVVTDLIIRYNPASLLRSVYAGEATPSELEQLRQYLKNHPLPGGTLGVNYARSTP